MIPIYTIEEHNEAYYVWYHAVSEGFLPARGNLLVHVDHHDDLDCGTYNHDFTIPMTTLEERKRFTYDVLGIATFIIPAFYDRLFDQMVNFKSVTPQRMKAKRAVIFAQTPQILNAMQYIPLIHKKYEDDPDSKYRFADYAEISLERIYPEKPWVLDIDLDYFCWDDSLSTVRQPTAEITKEEYERYQSQKYHPMKILADKIVEYSEKNGKYYLSLSTIGPPYRPVDEEKINARLDAFTLWLKEVEEPPAVIDICRSRLSGYCPSDQWELIEKGLLKRLGSVCELKPQRLI